MDVYAVGVVKRNLLKFFGKNKIILEKNREAVYVFEDYISARTYIEIYGAPHWQVFKSTMHPLIKIETYPRYASIRAWGAAGSLQNPTYRLIDRRWLTATRVATIESEALLPLSTELSSTVDL
jgi:hypothetical protein